MNVLGTTRVALRSGLLLFGRSLGFHLCCLVLSAAEVEDHTQEKSKEESHVWVFDLVEPVAPPQIPPFLTNSLPLGGVRIEYESQSEARW